MLYLMINDKMIKKTLVNLGSGSVHRILTWDRREGLELQDSCVGKPWVEVRLLNSVPLLFPTDRCSKDVERLSCRSLGLGKSVAPEPA